MTDIPDEAVEAAVASYREHKNFMGHTLDANPTALRAALEAALPHLPSVKDEMHALHCCGERREDCVYHERIRELEDGIASLGRAISNQGPVPRYHRQVMADHRREWPTLWRAIDDLRALLPDGATR